MKVVYILALLCLIALSNGLKIIIAHEFSRSQGFNSVNTFSTGAGIRRPVSGKGAPILSLSFPASEQLLNRARSGEAGNANDYMDEVFKKK